MRKLRTEMHGRMLGNGYCARPVEMDCYFESICESCNARRIQAGLGGLSPDEYEAAWQATQGFGDPSTRRSLSRSA
jgi:hypothetical protein